MIIRPGRWSTIPLVQSFWRRCGTGDIRVPYGK